MDKDGTSGWGWRTVRHFSWRWWFGSEFSTYEDVNCTTNLREQEGGNLRPGHSLGKHLPHVSTCMSDRNEDCDSKFRCEESLSHGGPMGRYRTYTVLAPVCHRRTSIDERFCAARIDARNLRTSKKVNIIAMLQWFYSCNCVVCWESDVLTLWQING